MSPINTVKVSTHTLCHSDQHTLSPTPAVTKYVSQSSEVSELKRRTLKLVEDDVVRTLERRLDELTSETVVRERLVQAAEAKASAAALPM